MDVNQINLGTIFQFAMEFFNLELQVMGYTFTFFNLFMYSIVAFIVLKIVFSIFSKD
ncbi:MAG: hypothetical protein K0Q49_2122 [Haloplasmataceae bacterium]|jgi:hypothetical protein|nr:hypothetical protein [Haloplasmataceae bacterium]